MSKTIIGGFVAGLILFFWQFASWGPLQVHASTLDYTPNQDKIMKVLNENLTPGQYIIPRAPLDATTEEAQAVSTANTGKPFAQIVYNHDYQFSMPFNLIRGFTLDLVIGLLLCWLFSKFADPNFGSIFLGSLAVGVIGYLSISYLNSIWFSTNSIPDMIDAIVGFGLVGAWLGWWLNR